MVSVVAAVGAGRSGAVRLLRRPLAVWVAFLIVHIVLGALCLYANGYPMGDVTFVYRPWAEQAGHGASVPGIDVPWVYPIVALVPILMPLVFGAANYDGGWLIVVTLLNAAALAALLARPSDRRVIAAWWWIGFLLLLGPVALGRIDTVSVAVAIVAVVWLRSRPRAAIVLLTLAAWIKVWPAAIVAAIIVASRRRVRALATAAGTSAIVFAVALAFGSGWNVLSFVTRQTSRGLQVEAPVSTFWVWAASLNAQGVSVYYDRDLLTFQVAGGGTGATASLMTPLLAVAAIVVALLGVRAVQRRAPLTRVLPPLALALVAALIAFNKVGSPQFVTWLAVPVVLGMLVEGRRFAVPAVLAALAAALTQSFYPYLYGELLSGNPAILAVLSARNLVYVVLLAWAVARLWRTGGSRAVQVAQPTSSRSSSEG